MRKEYTTIRVPTELVDEVDEFIKKIKLGYRNRSEFIIETIKNRIISLQTYLKE